MTRPEVRITAYPDGPLIVRGDVEIVDESGEQSGKANPRGARGPIALCRCGLSALKPLCDGTHKAAGFRTDR